MIRGRKREEPREVAVTLIRHGHNKGDELLPEGWENARGKGKLLKNIVRGSPVKFYSSPAKRAMQTAFALAEAFHPMMELASGKAPEELSSEELAKVLAKARIRVREGLRPMDRKNTESFERLSKELGIEGFCRKWLKGDQQLLDAVESPEEVVSRLRKQAVEFSKRVSERFKQRANLPRILKKPIHLVMVTHGPLPEAVVEQLSGRPVSSFGYDLLSGRGKLLDNLERVTLIIKGQRVWLRFRGEEIRIKG
ncbi:phosphoglycerate mutase family protein [Candidatus Micrarchaeota archaeon]|nr:phosphoglycerate mutase family protein [Candidatus Micrarchaeota archaeon]